MEKLKGLAIELDMDHLAVDRGLRGLKDNLRTVNSEMKRNMSAFDFGEKSVKKYETSLMGLNKKLEVQKVAVAEAKKEYEKMVEQHGRSSKEAEAAAREYNNQAAALNNLERYIEKTKNELAEFEKQQRIASSGWTKFGNKLETASGKLYTASEKMGAVGNALTNKITKPALTAGAALGTLALFKGFKRLVGIDTAKAQLKALGHDAKEVDQIMTAALNAVKGTSHGMDEAATTAASAVAAGVKPTKDLEKYLSLAADTASVANVPFNEMGDIFNKVQTTGKAQNDVLKQLSQRGIPIYQYLGKTIGKSTEEVEKMAREGKIDTKTFLKAVEKNIGGASKIIGEESFAAAWKNIGADIARIGANFLDAGGKGGGFFSKLKPMLVDFRGLLEKAERKSADLGVQFGKAFANMVEKVKDLKGSYDQLTPAQQDFINKVLLIAPAVAIGAGPAINMFSKLTAGVAGTLSVTSKLSKAIGVARGAGLAAGLVSLGPGMIAGVAVAGLTAVGVAAYAMYRKKQKANEVSFDLAESLSGEASALDKSASTFEKLSEKAKISNAELALLDDLNKRISKSSNPGEIKELQKQYDELAKKSGLSKDELERLFKANQHIIEQSPEVEKSISEQGNQFVTSTEKVYEQIEALRTLSQTQLTGEREKLLKQEEEIRGRIADKMNELAANEKRILDISKNVGMSKEEISARVEEINKRISEGNLTEQEAFALDAERNDLLSIKRDKHDEILEKLLEEQDQLRKSIDGEEKKLSKLDEVENQMANIRLANVGINEEGEKGLAALDESIAKNDEEIAKLEEKRSKNGELTEIEQERYDKLVKTTEKQREARDFIHDELGIYKDFNSLANAKLENADKSIQKNIESLAKTTDIKVEEGNIVKQIRDKNSEIDKIISGLEKEREKQGANTKEIDKQIAEQKEKKMWNDAILEQILKELGVWDKVKDSIEQGAKKEKEKGKAADDTKNKLDAQGNQIDKNNQKTDAGIKKEEVRSKEAGRDVNKDVKVSDKGKTDEINRKASESKNKDVHLKDRNTANVDKAAQAPKKKDVNLQARNTAELNRVASSPVTKVVNFVGKGLNKLKFWEKGTPPSGHPGGPAVIGERGSELVKLPSGQSFLSPGTHTLLDLPRGSHVIPHQETKRIVRNAPRYADGTKNWASAIGNSEMARMLTTYNRSSDVEVEIVNKGNEDKEDLTLKQLLTATLEQNRILMQLLDKDNTAVLAFDTLYNPIKQRLNQDQYSQHKQRRR